MALEWVAEAATPAAGPRQPAPAWHKLAGPIGEPGLNLVLLDSWRHGGVGQNGPGEQLREGRLGARASSG